MYAKTLTGGAPTIRNPIAAVLGDGHTLFDDFEALAERGEPVDVLACNRSWRVAPCGPDHFVCLDGGLWQREAMGMRGVQRHSVCELEGYDFCWGDVGSCEGTSTLLAVRIALMLGYRRVVLCGVPFDGLGYWYAPDAKSPHTEVQWNRAAWAKFSTQHGGANSVRSMSGWTRELLGAH